MKRLDEVIHEARQRPISSNIPPRVGGLVKGLKVYNTSENFKSDLLDPSFEFEHDIIVSVGADEAELPHVLFDGEIATPWLNTLDWSDQGTRQALADLMVEQSSIPSYIVSNSHEEAIVTVFVDGLSYEDIRGTELEEDAQPVFINGLTTTPCGYNRLVFGTPTPEKGDMSLFSRLLKNNKCENGLGLTYWSEGENTLSDQLYNAIPKGKRVKSDVLSKGLEAVLSKVTYNTSTYLQITRMGLDQYAHRQKEGVDKDNVVKQLIEDIHLIESRVADLFEDYRIFVTSDHGLLWRGQVDDMDVVGDDDGSKKARCTKDNTYSEYGFLTENENGDPIYTLTYPYFLRSFNSAEPAVHEGASYHESVTPLIEISN